MKFTKEEIDAINAGGEPPDYLDEQAKIYLRVLSGLNKVTLAMNQVKSIIKNKVKGGDPDELKRDPLLIMIPALVFSSFDQFHDKAGTVINALFKTDEHLEKVFDQFVESEKEYYPEYYGFSKEDGQCLN
mgnify:CR=1 FL=1